jgi:hypothetical protein
MNKRGCIHLFAAVCILFFCAPVLPCLQEYELQSEKTDDISEDHTKITIRCSTRNASVYLNGEYQGVTTLTISDLKPGRYVLRVEKDGYDPKEFIISVRNAQSQTWYVDLQKNTGIVTFTVQPEDSFIYVDGNSVSGSVAEVEEGSHTVLVRRFGYSDEKRPLLVFRRTVQNVNITLEPAVFAVSDLESGKKSFNPQNPGSLGTCTFSFNVTAHGSGTLTIKDASGTEVCSFAFPDFTTWIQKASWNGTDSTGRLVADGTYTAVLSAENQELSSFVTVDRTIRYPVASLTATGSGIGILPTAFMSPSGSHQIFVSAGAVFTTADSFEDSSHGPFYGSPVSFAFSGTPAPWLEYTLRASVLAGADSTPVSAGGALKFSHGIPVYGGINGGGAKIEEAAILRAGGTTETTYTPYGADTGNGLSAGAVFGIESLHAYAGVSSLFSFGSTTGSTKGSDCTWQNGIAVQFRSANTAIGAYGALNSCFGCSASDSDERSRSYWTRAVQTGIDFSSMFPDSAVSVSVKPSILIYCNGTVYPSVEIGISLFY